MCRRGSGVTGVSLADTGGLRALLMALRPSICHQSSEDEGAASAGAHVISTICDSTHEALVRTKISGFVFSGEERVEGRRGGRGAGCVYKNVYIPASIRLNFKCFRTNLC